MTVSITIAHDSDVESPRDYENLGTMVCFHNRYSLGDNDHGFSTSDYSGWTEMEAAILNKYGRDAFILPVYMLDHSGLALSTSSFHDPWDSGQVGFIVASRAKVRSDMGVSRITPKLAKQVFGWLKSEVEVYSKWLNGETYMMTVDYGDGEVDTIGGFIGSDPMENGMADNVSAEFHYAFENTTIE